MVSDEMTAGHEISSLKLRIRLKTWIYRSYGYCTLLINLRKISPSVVFNLFCQGRVMFKKGQWHLSMLTEVSSLPWTKLFEIIDAIRTDTMSFAGSKIINEEL